MLTAAAVAADGWPSQIEILSWEVRYAEQLNAEDSMVRSCGLIQSMGIKEKQPGLIYVDGLGRCEGQRRMAEVEGILDTIAKSFRQKFPNAGDFTIHVFDGRVTRRYGREGRDR
ncbi:MAG: hypothetical protein ACHQ9S_24115 [Candidatus Binatia bacterium]